MRRVAAGAALVFGLVLGLASPAAADNCSGLTDCGAGVRIALALLAIVLVAAIIFFAWEFVVAAAAEEAAAAAVALEEAAAAAPEAAAATAETVTAEAATAEAATAEAATAEASAADQLAIEKATTENSLNHIFQAKHQFDPLVQQFGGERPVVEQMLAGLKGQTPAAGRFEEVVRIGGQDVTVRGIVINGIVRISTAFIPFGAP
jgi:pyruvate/2-oxoglutarate dehydrogenase complex dihydrolipoamide acyltransferase (E2) component